MGYGGANVVGETRQSQLGGIGTPTRTESPARGQGYASGQTVVGSAPTTIPDRLISNVHPAGLRFLLR